MKGLEKLVNFSVIGLISVFATSCGLNLEGPRGRLGCPPCPTLITTYLGKDAAKHQRGIAYTCKAGHIDIAHVKKYAEWTEYFSKLSFKHLKQGNKEFSFKGREPGKYNFKIDYPENWDNLNEVKKQEIIEDVSINLGQYFSYTTSIWHEILTWFGWNATVFFISEFSSAFSWEDRFSDTFGCYVGSLALRNKTYSFDKALNLVLDKELKKLDIQSKSISRKAGQNVEGDWFRGGLFEKVIKRNLDIGYGDGYVSPSVPFVFECGNTHPVECLAPNFNSVREYGFLVKLELEPDSGTGRKALRISGKQKRINPEKDFPKIMDYIRRDALKRGYEVDD